MNNKIVLYTDRRQMRMMLVMLLYRYELLNEPFDANTIFENDELHNNFSYENISKNKRNEIYKNQIKLLNVIQNNYEKIKKIISSYIREDWNWERVSPIVRSILICACVELKTLDVGIVTNEYVEIAKDFIPDSNDYKFINKTIELIGKAFNEQNKNN